MGVKPTDRRYLRLFEDWLQAKQIGEKVTYIVACLADIYHLYLIARQIQPPLKSITLNLGNVHIYANNEAKTHELLAKRVTAYLPFDEKSSAL